MKKNKLLRLTLSTCLMWVLALSVQAQACYPSDLWNEYQNKRRARKEQVNQQRRSDKVPQMKATAYPTLYGTIYYDDNESYKPGLYSFNPSKAAFNLVADDDHLFASSGVFAHNKYYCISYKEMNGGSQISQINFSVYNADTWVEESSSYNLDWKCIATDLAFDPVSNKIYGCFFSPDVYNIQQAKVFATLNLENGQPEVIANLEKHLIALSCSKEGVLYGIAEDANLYTINKQTGTMTLVGSTGITVDPFFQAAVCDFESGKIYWTGACNEYGDHAIMEVNPKTGRAVILQNLFENSNNEQITGLAINQNAGGEISSPKEATELNFSANGAEHHGIFSFKMPEQDIQNKPLSGDLKYIVLVNGVQKEAGSAVAGKKVSCPLTFDQGGSYDLTVEVAFQDGTGIQSSSSLAIWIGQDIPTPVNNLMVEASGSTLNLSWTPSEGAVHGGYLGEVTYRVVRYPGKVVVVDNLKACEYVDKIADDAICTYSYDVIALAGGKESEAVRSNEVKIGSVVAVFPYRNDFATLENFKEFSVIDVNNDGSTWSFYAEQGCASYTYNPKNNADDWLVTPGVRLEASKLYKISLKTYNAYPVERISISFGSEATAEGMKEVLLPPYDVTYQPRIHELTATVIPEKNGVYYFGIRACSEADRSVLSVDDVEISEISGAAPAKVENMTVTPGEKGALNVRISFKAPVACIDGSALNNLKEFVIRRNKQEITRVAYNGQQEISYLDEGIQDNGLYAYSVTAVNEAGEGAENMASKYVGIDVPAAVKNFTVVEDLNEEGTLVLNWDAPSVGQNGGYIDPEGLTYYVSVGLATEAVSNGKSTTFRDKVNITRGQTYQGYSVYAENEVGSGRNVWQTKVAVAGPAMKAPYYDSFTNVHFNGPWLTQMVKGDIFEASWIVLDGTQLTSWSHDDDKGVLSFSTAGLNRAARIESPKIDIRSVDGATLVFWVYMTGKSDKLDVQVSPEFKPFETVKEITLNEENGKWKRFEVSLDAYKNSRFIQVGFLGTAVESTEQIISLDNISIKKQLNKDVELVSLDVKTQRVEVGDYCVLELVVRNSGTKDLNPEDYKIEIYKNDRLAVTVPGKVLSADKRATILTNCEITVADKEDTYIQAVLKYEGDELLENNQSDKKMIRVVLPNFPAITDLTGVTGSNYVELSWGEPDVSNHKATPVTDHFEDYQAFTIDDFGGWKVYDGDKAKTIQLTLSIEDGPLNYPNAGKPMAFQVFNPALAGISFRSWVPFSGEQMLCAFKCTSVEERAPKNDDWLISPELSGDAQCLTFYAKAGMAAEYEDGSMTVPEEFEVYYSTTSDEIASFIKMGQTVEISETKTWEEVRVDLPEGTKYFAIRCVSDNKFVLMLDDFTYIPAGAPVEDISLEAYNVYKNGEKLAETGEAYYQDYQVENGKEYSYNVTARYDKGESVFSNDFVIVFTPSSINENEMCQVLVYAKDGSLMIQGADHVQVAVYTLTGDCLFREMVTDDVTVPVAEGIYLVKVGNQVNKVLVK